MRPAHDFDPSGQVENFTLEPGQTLQLKPRQFLLAQTLERVFVPPQLAAHVNGKSSLAPAGLAVHITAPHIHPGFVGPITLELFNHGEWEREFSQARTLCVRSYSGKSGRRHGPRQLRLWEPTTTSRNLIPREENGE